MGAKHLPGLPGETSLNIPAALDAEFRPSRIEHIAVRTINPGPFLLHPVYFYL